MPAMGQKKQDQKQSEINFSLSDISAIIEMLRENEVFEFCLEKGSDRLWLKRGNEPSSYEIKEEKDNQEINSTKTEESNNIVKLPIASPSTETAPPTVPTPSTSTLEIKSPMVGTFYRRPAVDAEPYIEVGDTIKKGDVLCIIEAMKIMNEIEAEISGKVVEILLDDGQMAEYGEALFRIEPNA